MDYEHIIHSFDPVFDKNSRILIMGSMPSVKSRECGFYYGHPRNRFWTVISAITGSPLPHSTEDKKKLLLDHGIAIWDTAAECDIIGSSDQKIKNVVPTDLRIITDKCNIEAIFANGAAAANMYRKYQKHTLGKEIMILPSTSPANAAWSTERLIKEWSKIREYLQKNDL